MKSIEEMLNRFMQGKDNIRGAIMSKGVGVPSKLPFIQYADKIRMIEGGESADYPLVRGWSVNGGFTAVEIPTVLPQLKGTTALIAVNPVHEKPIQSWIRTSFTLTPEATTRYDPIPYTNTPKLIEVNSVNMEPWEASNA